MSAESIPQEQVTDRIDRLDLSLFAAISSQTSDEEKCSLLAVQRATAKRNFEYTYLEIGSHLGGSIQPHLLDARCTQIYSLDPRPSHQPDDRSTGFIATYEDNSTERMLKLLRSVHEGGIQKMQCYDADASEVEATDIKISPLIVFMDGEHTVKAVLSDYQFCKQVVHERGTILFHDSGIVVRAIWSICQQLKKSKVSFTATRLGGGVFAIFMEQNMVRSDEFLRDCYDRNRWWLRRTMARAIVRNLLPRWAVRMLRRIQSLFLRQGS